MRTRLILAVIAGIGLSVPLHAQSIFPSSGGVSPATTTVTCTGTADQTAINAAITALPSGGGRVVLLQGTCSLGASITITKSNVTLEGQGDSTIIQQVAGSASLTGGLIVVGDGSATYNNIGIRNLTIDGNSSNVTGFSYGVDIKNLNFRYLIENTKFINITLRSIREETADGQNTYSVIRNNYITSPRECIKSFSEGIGGGELIEGNTFICVFGAIPIITGTGTEYPIRIHNNTFIGNGTGDYEIYSQKMAIITGNTFQDIQYGGIKVSIGPSVVTGNNFYITTNPTHNLIDVATYATVAGNAIEVYTGNTVAITAIKVGSNSTVTGNTIKFWTAYNHIGISAQSITTGTIAGNHLVNTGAGAPKGVDITSATDVSVSSNSFQGFTTAVLATSAQDISIAGNDFANNNTTGVNINKTTNAVVVGNAFYGGTGITSAGGGTTTSPILVGNSLGSSSTVTLTGAVTVTRFDATAATIAGTSIVPLRGVTSSVSGNLTLGTCDTGTATVTGATNGMVASASPTTYPGTGVTWFAYVSSADTVTVTECGLAIVTPTATTYQVAVIP